MDDPNEDSLKEIEAYLTGEERPVQAPGEAQGFDEMLKAALDTATTAAPAVQDNDAWLDAILAETEEESSAAVSELYGSNDAPPTSGDLGDSGVARAQMKQAPLGRQVGGSAAPAKQRAQQEADDSLEDAVAAALRSVALPVAGGGGTPLAEQRMVAPRRGAGGAMARGRRLPPRPAPSSLDGPEALGSEPPVPVAEESDKVKQLRKQVEQFGRETEKYRERMEEQAKQARTKGRQDVFDRLLPILDTLDIAIQSAPSAKSVDKVIAGVEMVFGQLLTELSRLGLECINPMGETFDPALHEAMQKSETGAVESGKINKVLRRGFVMDGKIVRAAQVIVEV